MGLNRRSLSFTEISTALTCEARWDFAYGGFLAGSTLKRRDIAARLSDGRAWGAALATWHATGDRWAAYDAIRTSYAQDVEEQTELGVWVPIETYVLAMTRLGEMLDHYMATSPKLPNLTRIEDELVTPIPHSDAEFLCFIDGYSEQGAKGDWLVEYKLRDTLTPVKLIHKSRQVRWYSWSLQQETGRPIAGVLIDERWNKTPQPPRLVSDRKGGLRPSHAVAQHITPEDYLAICQEFNEKESQETLDHFKGLTWQQRVPIIFRPGELEEAGRELTSAAQKIEELDSGLRYPIRNAQPMLCRTCKFEGICDNPHDLMVDSLFVRTVPKRDREQMEQPA